MSKAARNIWQQEYEEGIEISMPHRPVLDDNGNEVLDDDGYIVHHKMRIRSLDAGYIMQSGKVPSGLMDVAVETITALGVSAGGNSESTLSDKMTKAEALEKFLEFQHFVVTQMLVFPKVVEEPKADNEVSYDMLTSEDKYFLLTLIDAPLDSLRRFRVKPDADMESVPEVESDATPTE